MELASADAMGLERPPMGGSARISFERDGSAVDMDTGQPTNVDQPAIPQGNGVGRSPTDIAALAREGGDPLDTIVLPKIRQVEGTAAGEGHVLYGGQPYTPGKEHPATYGWQGGVGPDGRQTHAADRYQWQPSTWEEEKRRFAERGIQLDFSNPQHQDVAAKDLAMRTYREKTGRDLQADAAAGKVEWSALSGRWGGFANPSKDLRSWANGMSPALRAQADVLTKEADTLRDQYHADASELMRQANTATPGSKERDAAIAKLREREHEYRAKYEEIDTHPPVMKPVDALENFGSAATVIALLGGLFARRHITAALGAAGHAMEAINQNNYDQFQRAYKTWEQQTNTALQMVKLHNDEIRELINDKKLSEDEKNTRLQLAFQSLGMQRQADMMALGAHEKVFTEQAGLERATHAASQAQKSVQLAGYNADVQSGMPPHEAAKRWGLVPPSAGKIDAKTEAAEAFKKKKLEETGKEPSYEDWVKYSQETKGFATGQLSPDAVKMLAQQYEMGDPGVITSLPRGGPARIQVENQVAEDLRTMDEGAQKIVMNRLRMAEAKSAATTAGRITMQTELYAQEAVGAGKQVVETSKLFSRTNFPKINEALQAFERGTGDPNVVRFGAALNAFVNTYGKLSNPAGIGIHDADKERIVKILDTSLSQGQIEAAVDQVIKEGRIVSTAARQAQVEVLAGLVPSPAGSPPPPQNTPPDASGGVIRYDAQGNRVQ